MKRMIAILLLLTLSLSMWGCSSNPTSTTQPNQQPNRPNSSASSQRPNNNNSSNNNSSAKIDPNGFSTMEQCIDVYLAYVYGKASKTQLYKMKPVQYWDAEIADKSFNDFNNLYSEYVNNFTENRKKHEERYGADFQVTYKIISYEVTKDFSEEGIGTDEEQECIDTYGVSSKKVRLYSVLISITIKGSKAEESGQQEVSCLKVGTKWYF